MLHAVLFGPSYPDLPAALCQGLLRVQDAGHLTLREALVMHCVLTTPNPPSVTEIGILIGVPQPSVSRCLARLTKMGLVDRAIGRGKRILITPSVSGRELIA